VQLVGTIFFNLSTASALVSTLDTAGIDKHVWRPDALGSICFLVASALALVATTEADGLWDPQARTWVTSWLNMAGSVFFGFSAIASYVVPDSGTVRNAMVVNLGTFAGAICFLVAAWLLPPTATISGAAVS
jgi:YrhK-like protein